MAESETGDRTERATPKRRNTAREEGQVARSMEVNSVVVLLAGFLGTWITMGWMGERLRATCLYYFGQAGEVDLDSVQGALGVLGVGTRETMLALLPVLLVTLAAGTAVALAQVGLHWSNKAMHFNTAKLNPINGIKQRFTSKQTFFELGKNLLKVILLGAVAVLAIRSMLPDLVGLSSLAVVPAWREAVVLMLKLLLRMLAVLAVLAVIDMWFQKHRHEESIKMTKEEVKREHKDAEGDPQVRARIRSMMLEQLRRVMMDNVRKADVVVTNPTHFSVAIRYRADEGAPRVVGKGQGHLALRIREIARENKVPIIENPPLARALYRAADVGDYVPADLFEGVAQVLAAVYRADRKRAAAAGV